MGTVGGRGVAGDAKTRGKNKLRLRFKTKIAKKKGGGLIFINYIPTTWDKCHQNITNQKCLQKWEF